MTQALLSLNIFAFLFEVMDKEPSFVEIYLLFLTVGVAGFLLCLWRNWLLVIVIPVALFFALGLSTELADPYVGPSILAEAGRGYVVQSCLAMLLSLALPLLGAIIGWRKKS